MINGKWRFPTRTHRVDKYFRNSLGSSSPNYTFWDFLMISYEWALPIDHFAGYIHFPPLIGRISIVSTAGRDKFQAMVAIDASQRLCVKPRVMSRTLRPYFTPSMCVFSPWPWAAGGVVRDYKATTSRPQPQSSHPSDGGLNNNTSRHSQTWSNIDGLCAGVFGCVWVCVCVCVCVLVSVWVSECVTRFNRR